MTKGQGNIIHNPMRLENGSIWNELQVKLVTKKLTGSYLVMA